MASEVPCWGDKHYRDAERALFRGLRLAFEKTVPVPVRQSCPYLDTNKEDGQNSEVPTIGKEHVALENARLLSAPIFALPPSKSEPLALTSMGGGGGGGAAAAKVEQKPAEGAAAAAADGGDKKEGGDSAAAAAAAPAADNAVANSNNNTAHNFLSGAGDNNRGPLVSATCMTPFIERCRTLLREYLDRGRFWKRRQKNPRYLHLLVVAHLLAQLKTAHTFYDQKEVIGYTIRYLAQSLELFHASESGDLAATLVHVNMTIVDTLKQLLKVLENQDSNQSLGTKLRQATDVAKGVLNDAFRVISFASKEEVALPTIVSCFHPALARDAAQLLTGHGLLGQAISWIASRPEVGQVFEARPQLLLQERCKLLESVAGGNLQHSVEEDRTLPSMIKSNTQLMNDLTELTLELVRLAEANCCIADASAILDSVGEFSVSNSDVAQPLLVYLLDTFVEIVHRVADRTKSINTQLANMDTSLQLAAARGEANAKNANSDVPEDSVYWAKQNKPWMMHSASALSSRVARIDPLIAEVKQALTEDVPMRMASAKKRFELLCARVAAFSDSNSAELGVKPYGGALDNGGGNAGAIEGGNSNSADDFAVENKKVYFTTTKPLKAAKLGADPSHEDYASSTGCALALPQGRVLVSRACDNKNLYLVTVDTQKLQRPPNTADFLKTAIEQVNKSSGGGDNNKSRGGGGVQPALRVPGGAPLDLEVTTAPLASYTQQPIVAFSPIVYPDSENDFATVRASAVSASHILIVRVGSGKVLIERSFDTTSKPASILAVPERLTRTVLRQRPATHHCWLFSRGGDMCSVSRSAGAGEIQPLGISVRGGGDASSSSSSSDKQTVIVALQLPTTIGGGVSPSAALLHAAGNDTLQLQTGQRIRCVQSDAGKHSLVGSKVVGLACPMPGVALVIRAHSVELFDVASGVVRSTAHLAGHLAENWCVIDGRHCVCVGRMVPGRGGEALGRAAGESVENVLVAVSWLVFDEGSLVITTTQVGLVPRKTLFDPSYELREDTPENSSNKTATGFAALTGENSTAGLTVWALGVDGEMTMFQMH